VGTERSKRKSSPVSEALAEASGGLQSAVAFITLFLCALSNSLHLFCPQLSKQHMGIISINPLLVSKLRYCCDEQSMAAGELMLLLKSAVFFIFLTKGKC